MEKHTMTNLTIGIDLGDRWSRFCVINADGDVIERGKLTTARDALGKWASQIAKCRMVVEVGTHSPWVSRILQTHGHDVLVANPRQLKLIYQDGRKNDNRDAEHLARLGRFDPKLLKPIHHRGEEAQRCRALLQARDALVHVRTTLINHVRGSVKSFGYRIRASYSAEAFGTKARADLPRELAPTLSPILDQIEQLTTQIRAYDREVEKLAKEKYPEAQVVAQIKGVGPITSLAFVLVVEDPSRFTKSRDVGPYLGLVPKRQDSGDQNPQLRITKTGDEYVRRLLVGAAQYILGPFGPDCDLRRHGEAICARGGKNAKKRAVIAVARKLAILMHRLWTTGEIYEPLRNAQKVAA
jgi:transposase